MDGRERLVALDLIRGVAVLGILAVNIAGFAGPSAAVLSPHVPSHGNFADEAAYGAVFLVFEGKMRALFSLLFGAGMAIFVSRADARGEHGAALQLRRLGWLMVFGLLHYFLFWWGDILFTYALAGMVALILRGLSTRALLAGALILFTVWHAAGAAHTLERVRIEEAVRTGSASTEEWTDQRRADDAMADQADAELREYRMGFTAQVAAKLRERPFWPLEMALNSFGETLPFMLIGMVLQRMGLFAGHGRARRLRRWGTVALICGGAWTLAILAWAWPRHYPPYAMHAALTYWAAPAHLAMAIGYAVLLASAAARLAATHAGALLIRAGRMAFSNYLGTTIVMTAIFHGWGLNLAGRFGEAELLAFVALGWALMLLGSAAWLSVFRQGPVEWLWRSLAGTPSIRRAP